jgi:hypothetical protein
MQLLREDGVTMRTVVQTEAGWSVVDRDGTVVRNFVTNAEAWRYLDRNNEAEDTYNRIRMAVNGREGMCRIGTEVNCKL